MFEERIKCGCGSNIKSTSWQGHVKTKKHLAYQQESKEYKGIKHASLQELGKCLWCEQTVIGEGMRCPECHVEWQQARRIDPLLYL